MPGLFSQEGIFNQAILTPDLNQQVQSVNIVKAQNIYATQLQPYLSVGIGEPVSQQNLTGLSCQQIVTIKEEYKAIINLVNSNTTNTSNNEQNATTLATNSAALSRDVATLTQQRDDLLEDKKTAELRDNVLRSGNSAVTSHQIYLLGRPLRPASIPYIWVLSVLFIGLAVLILYMFFPYTIPPIDIVLMDIYFFFSNPWVWSILFGLASIVILFLSLNIAKII